MVKQMTNHEPRPTPANVRATVAEITAGALVRLADGRLGVLRRNRKAGKSAVFLGDVEVPVGPDELLTVWLWDGSVAYLLRDILVGRVGVDDLGELMVFSTENAGWMWWGKRLAEAETADRATVALGKLCEIFPAATDMWVKIHAQRLEILAKAREMVDGGEV